MKELVVNRTITPRTSSAVERYLREIAREPMLTPEEEVTLAQRVKAGDQVSLDRLVRGNLRFVVTVAKMYQNQGLSLEDLISEGNVGLQIAAKRFDETRGFKFCSYAVWWIRQSIAAAITEHSRMVRLPANKVNMMHRINAFARGFEQENQRRPTMSEMSDALGIPEQQLANLNSATAQAVSLDRPLQDDGEVSMMDTLPSDTPATDAGLMHESNSIVVHELLSRLSGIEREVLMLTYGIDQDRAFTTDEVALQIGLSKERVRQLCKKGLSRMLEVAERGKNLYEDVGEE